MTPAKFYSAFREQAGFTQEQLANLAGYSTNHISLIERGQIVPRFDSFLELYRFAHTPKGRAQGLDRLVHDFFEDLET